MVSHPWIDPKTFSPRVQWLYSLYHCMSHATNANKVRRFLVQDRAQQKCVMFDMIEPILRCPDDAVVPHGPDPPRGIDGYKDQSEHASIMLSEVRPVTTSGLRRATDPTSETTSPPDPASFRLPVSETTRRSCLYDS